MSPFNPYKIAKQVDIVCLEESFAIEKYQECPKYVTIILHADHEDDSLFHCVLSKPFIGPHALRGQSTYNRDFIVPGQEIILLHDEKYGLFTLLKVLDTNEGPPYWLISSVTSRMGFLTHYDSLPADILFRNSVAA